MPSLARDVIGPAWAVSWGVVVALVGAGCGGTNAGTDDGPADGLASDASTVDAPGFPDGGTCGTRTSMRGLTQRSVMIDGLRRTYTVYLPPDADPTTPLPLVTVFHGFTMSGQNMVDITHYTELADTEHIAVAFPDGQGGPSSSVAPWNVGRAFDVCPSYAGAPPSATGNDFAFMDAMQLDIAQDQCVDGDHRYATGFSMGGYFAHEVGCKRPDIRAVAPAAGGTHDLTDCPSVHKPIIIFHGASDPLVPAGCDDPKAPAVAGHEASAAMWARHNGCATTTTRITVMGGHCDIYDGCPADGQVELCSFDSMGHCWAGGVQGTYGCSAYASATQLQWDFFKQHAW